MSRYAGVLLAEAGLPECCELVGYEPPPEVVAEAPRPGAARHAARPVATESSPASSVIAGRARRRHL